MNASLLEFAHEVRHLRIGGIPVVIGQLARDGSGCPVIFAAALSESDLRRESCGYGTTESGAVADLLRLMRP